MRTDVVSGIPVDQRGKLGARLLGPRARIERFKALQRCAQLLARQHAPAAGSLLAIAERRASA